MGRWCRRRRSCIKAAGSLRRGLIDISNSWNHEDRKIITICNLNAIMVADASFEGWVGLDAESANGKMVWQGYQPKTFEETDVEIEARLAASG